MDRHLWELTEDGLINFTDGSYLEFYPPFTHPCGDEFEDGDFLDYLVVFGEGTVHITCEVCGENHTINL